MVLNKKKDNTSYISLLLFGGLFGCFFENYYALHLFLILGTIFFSLKGGIPALQFFTVYTFVQNIFLIFFSTSLTSLDTQLIIFYKELMVYLVAFFYIFKSGFGGINRDRMSQITFLLLCLLFIFNISRPGAPIYFKIVALRQILIPLVCYIFGYSIYANSKGLRYYFHFFVGWIMFFCLIGFIIYIADDNFWNYINYPNYFLNKNGVHYEGLYSNFYSHDFGPRLKRFTSFLADPIASAHLIGLAVLMEITFFKRQLLRNFIIAISAFLCFSKTIIFLLLSAAYIYFFLKIEKQIYKMLFYIFAIIFFIICFMYANIYVANLESDTAAGNHLKSLLFALNNNTIWGEGLGAAGYLAGIMGNDITIEYNESFFAMIIAQMGIVGAMLYYGYLFLLVKGMIGQYRKWRSPLLLLAIILVSGIVFESVVSGSSITMLGTGLYFILAGLLVRNHKRYI